MGRLCYDRESKSYESESLAKCQESKIPKHPKNPKTKGF